MIFAVLFNGLVAAGWGFYGLTLIYGGLKTGRFAILWGALGGLFFLACAVGLLTALLFAVKRWWKGEPP